MNSSKVIYIHEYKKNRKLKYKIKKLIRKLKNKKIMSLIILGVLLVVGSSIIIFANNLQQSGDISAFLPLVGMTIALLVLPIPFTGVFLALLYLIEIDKKK